ncbi:phosphatidylglycerophosphatase A [Elioraea sp.]|uniref:phosphatidylglycerophosphatase A family protein n=1 Tax=Elioraea sp. TaxID=2185103 RepID=UPI0021DBFCA8|nr:phosphatidylglycerophosphatase A [Elioraea sp.]GIX11153.1 MAG: phosphatidylglycerophosphatase A [Elioraea sp.]
MTRALASLCGAGFLRPAPGTWGSALALIPGAALLAFAGPAAVAAGAALLAALGWWAVARELPRSDEPDPGWIVIDEAAGMWLALVGLPGFGWLGTAAAFALFRLLDVAKPGPVGWADRRGGVAGVMLDDLIAGALAAVALLALSFVLPAEWFP